MEYHKFLMSVVAESTHTSIGGLMKDQQSFGLLSGGGPKYRKLEDNSDKNKLDLISTHSITTDILIPSTCALTINWMIGLQSDKRI